MFRILGFLAVLSALIGFVLSAYWYFTTPQPARFDMQMAYLRDTVEFKYRNFSRPGHIDELNFWRPIARENNMVAQLRVAELLYARAEKYPSSYEEAFLYLDIVANKGIPMAQNALAVSYCHGLGVAQNRIECFKWFSLAASRGYALAQKNMIDMSRELTTEEMIDVESRVAAWKMQYEGRDLNR